MNTELIYLRQHVLLPADAGAEDRVEGVGLTNTASLMNPALTCLRQNALPGAFSVVNIAASGRVDGRHLTNEALLMNVDPVYLWQIARSDRNPLSPALRSTGATDALFGCVTDDRRSSLSVTDRAGRSSFVTADAAAGGRDKISVQLPARRTRSK